MNKEHLQNEFFHYRSDFQLTKGKGESFGIELRQRGLIKRIPKRLNLC